MGRFLPAVVNVMVILSALVAGVMAFMAEDIERIALIVIVVAIYWRLGER